MSHPTFEEAVHHWPRLSADDLHETAGEDDLYQVCEEVILSREIKSHEDALVVCQVLLANLKSGQRSDELDIQALTSLRSWIAAVANGEGLARPSPSGK